jgi:molecular chaperone HscB
MTSDTTTSKSVQICRSCGGGAPVDVHFCPQCTRILTLGRQGDYFAFMGLPRKLHIDGGDLERRFRELSRQFHPDYFHNAPPAERRASLERTSYLNDAYRTLKSAHLRTGYLLELEGYGSAGPPGSDGDWKQVPPALLEEVFALNEELDAVRELRQQGAAPERWRARLHEAREPIEEKRKAHEALLQELSERWDRLVDGQRDLAARRETLEALRQCMLERNYIGNLLAGIEKELGTAS